MASKEKEKLSPPSVCSKQTKFASESVNDPLQISPVKQKPVRRSLLSMCVASLGYHLHEIIVDIHLISSVLPPSVKIQLVAIARRRGLLSDNLLVPMADESWELLDLSGSDVTDEGVFHVAKVCTNLKTIDVSCCSRLTALSIQAFVGHCPALKTLRCGGTHMSNTAARLALPRILPGLNVSEDVGESWEDLETETVGSGAQSLGWIVWPAIDEKSKETVKIQCPRVIVNPRAPKSFEPQTVPREALPKTVLDEIFVQDIPPTTWDLRSTHATERSSLADDNVTMAERFRLAFVARDERLAPKRAKNIRQNQRRMEKIWLSSNVDAKARRLATSYQ